jgi:hypothetical protein
MWLNRPLDAISSEHERHLVGQACCARDCDLSHTRYILRGFARNPALDEEKVSLPGAAATRSLSAHLPKADEAFSLHISLGMAYARIVLAWTRGRSR